MTQDTKNVCMVSYSSSCSCVCCRKKLDQLDIGVFASHSLCLMQQLLDIRPQNEFHT